MVRLTEDNLEEDDNLSLLDWVSDDNDDGDGDDDDAEGPDLSFPSAVIIANCPKVGKEKHDKLMNVIGKLTDKSGPNERVMPHDEKTNMSYGFVIAKYESPSAAQSAVDTLDGMSLDKNHTFKVIKLDDYDKITTMSNQFKAAGSGERYSRVDFKNWMLDEKGREQLLLRYQDETEIYWNDPIKGVPLLCYGGEREKRQKKMWCDWRVQWSPNGSYLATFHRPGIALWAGDDFTKKIRMAHEHVKYIEFSPTEEYVLTWNGTHPNDRDEKAVRIFHTLTGEEKRCFPTPTCTPLGGEFPHFLWSKDGKYLARCNEKDLYVYETGNFQLLADDTGKKAALKFDGLAYFDWSPKDNLISVWTPEKGNNPARLVLVEIPSRKEIASRSRTQVEAQIFWQSAGDYLCLMVTKLSKTKKKGNTNLEIFRIREKNIPVDTVEISDVVRGFHWETKGNRFATLTTDETGHHPKLTFFTLANSKCDAILTFDLPQNTFNSVFWAPEGEYFVCAGIPGGDLLFGQLTQDNKLEILHKDEHFMLTDVMWDPSSRYVITAVVQPMKDQAGGFKYQMEAGYSIWTFQGRALYRCQKEKLWQVFWRPHPPSGLSETAQEDIRKSLKKYSKKYDQIDDQAKEAARSAFRKEREDKMRSFMGVINRIEAYYWKKLEETGWDEGWREIDAESQWVESQEVVEETMETHEELISG